MIGIFLGEQDSGKTLSMTYHTFNFYTSGFNIYSNYNLEFKHNKLTSDLLISCVKDKLQFNKAVFCIDELYLILDSRSFSGKKSKLISYLILQSSKRDTHIFGTAQYFNTVDLRFRDNITFMCYCFRVQKVGNEYIDIPKGKRILDNSDNLYIKNVFLLRQNYDKFTKKIFYLKAKPIFKLYNTKEIMGLE